jgi:hypothetical protein
VDEAGSERTTDQVDQGRRRNVMRGEEGTIRVDR